MNRACDQSGTPLPAEGEVPANPLEVRGRLGSIFLEMTLERAMDHRPSVELLESTHSFPGEYKIKAIGSADDDFESRVVEAVSALLAGSLGPGLLGPEHAGRTARRDHAGHDRADGRAGSGDLRRDQEVKGLTHLF